MVEKIGHYTIVKELGRGGMGVVYKAHEESLNRYVAIKVLGDHLAADPAHVERFLREAQSAARLSHPNIVQIHTVGEDEGLHYFVMEFVTGSSLQQTLKKHRQMAAQDALRLVLQAAAGLAAAHDEGVIHRDIKPANLLIDERGLVKIADFGLALMREVMNRLTATGMVMGTPGYLAPEQCMEMDVDHRADIYSLGVTLFEMLAGRMPFEASSPLAMLRMILDVEPPDLQQLNPEVDSGTRAILARMMAKNREERYEDCHQLIADLQTHLDRLVAAGVGLQTGVTKPLVSAPPVPSGPPKPRSFDDGDTLGVGLREGLQSPAPAGAPPPPPGNPVATPTPVSATAPTASRHNSSSIALIAVVCIVGIAAGVALFFGLSWWLKRGQDVVQSTQKPPPVVATATPAGSSAAATAAEPDHDPAESQLTKTRPEAEPTIPAAGGFDEQDQGSRTLMEPPTPTSVPTIPPTRAPKFAPAASPTTVVVAQHSVPTPTGVSTLPEKQVIESTESEVVDEADQLMYQMLDDLRSGDFAKEQYAAKKLYRTYRNDPRILEPVSTALLEGFGRDLDDGRHVDAMAWLCNILGASEDQRYASTLERVAREGEGRKIRGYAKKNLDRLR